MHSTRALISLTLGFLFSAAAFAQNGNHAQPPPPVGVAVASPAPTPPPAEFCSPAFAEDPRYFPDPSLQPLLDAIEIAQRNAATALHNRANLTQNGQPAMGWMGLRTHLTGSQASGARNADDREFASWALYLNLAGPQALSTLRRYDRTFLDRVIREESARRHGQATSAEFLRQLPVNRGAGEPFTPIDWAAWMNDEAAVQQTFRTVFANNEAMPAPDAGLSVWREKAIAFAGNPRSFPLSQYNYFELTVLKEHLLNRFDAFSSAQIDWEDTEIDREGSPIRNHLAYFRKPPRLEGEARRRYRASERRDACTQPTEELRSYGEFVAHYSGALDTQQRLAPAQWHRHGLPLEFRAAMMTRIRNSPLHPNLRDAAVAFNQVAGAQPPNLNLIDANHRSGGFAGNQFLYLLYNSATQPPDLAHTFFAESARAVPPDQEAERTRALARLDGANDLLNLYDSHNRHSQVQVLDRLFSQHGRRLTDEEKHQMARLAPGDFNRLYSLVHGVVGADPRGFAPQVRNWVQRYLPIQTPVSDPENGVLLRGLDLTRADGVGFNPAVLTEYRWFEFPADVTPAASDWLINRNLQIRDHFAASVRDIETARRNYPTRGRLFAAFDHRYKTFYQRSLSERFCGKAACDAAQADQPFTDAEFLAAARAMHIDALRARHPEVRAATPESVSPGLHLLAMGVSQAQYEHDLIEAELKRLNDAMACTDATQPCLRAEAQQAKEGLFRMLHQELENERRELSERPHDLTGGDAAVAFRTRALAQWRASLERTETLLAREYFAHLTTPSSAESHVGFDQSAYLGGAVPARGPERYMSLEEGMVPHPMQRYVTLRFPCENGNSITLNDVPDSVLQSPLVFRNYLKRRAMVDALKAARFSDAEIDDILRGRQVRDHLIWTREALERRFGIGAMAENGYSPRPHTIRAFLATNPSECSTRPDPMLKMAGWMALLRGDSRANTEYRDLYDGMDAALDRVFRLAGGRNVQITYQTAPAELQALVTQLQGLSPEAATAQVRALAHGDDAARRQYRGLLSYTNRFPVDHPLRQLVVGPSIPPHLAAAFANDPCRREQPKTKLCLEELWDATPPDFQIREHAHFALGVHPVNEPTAALETRLRAAVDTGRRQLAGNQSGNNQNPRPTGSGHSYAPSRDLIEGTNRAWVQRAMQTNGAEFNTVLDHPELALEALERLPADPPHQRLQALADARGYYLTNLASVRALRAGRGGIGLDGPFSAWVYGSSHQPDAQKLARLDSILTALVSHLNAMNHEEVGALVDRNALAFGPTDLVTEQVALLERAYRSSEEGNFNRREWTSLHGVYFSRLIVDKEGVSPRDPRMVTMDDHLYGTAACAGFLSRQDGKFGYKYQGIPSGSRVLLSRLPVGLRDMLEAMCHFVANPPNEALDRAIAEAILGAWPNRVMSVLMRADAEPLRRLYAERLTRQLRERQTASAQMISMRLRNDHRNGYPPVPPRQYPDYRHYAAFIGTAPFSFPPEEPWRSLQAGWSQLGIGGFVLALPTMSPADKEAMRRWVLRELVQGVSPERLAQLRAMPPEELARALPGEFESANTGRFAVRDGFSGHVGQSSDADKHVLLTMLALLNEAGNTTLSGADASAREQALGGYVRFSPTVVALAETELESMGPGATPRFDAPRADDQFRGAFSDAQVWESYLRETTHAPNGAPIPAREAMHRFVEQHLARGGLLDQCATSSPASLTADQRRERREALLARMRDLRQVEPRDSHRFPGPQIGPDWRQVWALYESALRAVDHADQVETEVPPSPHQIVAGRMVTRQRPVTPPEPGAREVHLSEPARSFALLTGSLNRDATNSLSRVCVPGDAHWTAVLGNRDQIQSNLIDHINSLRRSYNDPNSEARRAAENDVSPAFVQNSFAMLDTMERIGLANLLRLRDLPLGTLADELNPLGYRWGNEAIFHPLAENAEALQNADVKTRVRAAVERARTAFNRSPRRAEVQRLLPEWTMRIEALFHDAEAILNAPDAATRAPLQAQYRRELREAQTLERQRLSRFGLAEWSRELQDQCEAQRNRSVALLNGRNPDQPIDYENSPHHRRDRYLAMLGLGEKAGIPTYAYAITRHRPLPEVQRAVDELKRARAAYVNDTAARALLREVSDDYEARLLPFFDRLIQVGESQLAARRAVSPAIALMERYYIPYNGSATVLPFQELLPWQLPMLTRERALELRAELENDLRTARENQPLRDELDRLHPEVREHLIRTQSHLLYVVNQFLGSSHPATDPLVMQGSQHASGTVNELLALTRPLVDAGNALTEAQRGAEAQIALIRQAERDAYAPHFVAEAPAPRAVVPVVAPAPRLAGVAPGLPSGPAPVAPTAPAAQPQQLHQILGLLAAANLSLSPGQRAEILSRDPETNQILIDLHPLMHNVLPSQGVQGLPQYWQRLALEGSPQDIRLARSMLAPSSHEFHVRSDISPAQLRQQVRDEISRNGVLSPQTQSVVERLAQIDILQKWLPQRLQAVFSQVSPEDARALMEGLGQQLLTLTAARQRELEAELRHEVALSAANQYLDQLTRNLRAAGDANPEATAQQTMHLLVTWAPHDPRTLEQAARTAVTTHADFVARLRTIYNVKPLDLYVRGLAESANAAGLSHPQSLPVLLGNFVPAVQRAAEARLTAHPEESASQAFETALHEVMEHADFQGHGEALREIEGRRGRDVRAVWTGARGPGSALTQDLAVERANPREQWCRANTENHWTTWQTRQAERAQTFEQSDSARRWVELRRESTWRTDAITQQYSETVARINRHQQEIQILQQKITDFESVQGNDEWNRLPDGEKARYRTTHAAVVADLQAKQGNLEAAYRELRDLDGTMHTLTTELTRRQSELRNQLAESLIDHENTQSTPQQFFILRAVAGAADRRNISAQQRQRTAWVERYFDWRERAEALGSSLAENAPLGTTPANWQQSASVQQMLREVQSTQDGCAVPAARGLEIVQAAMEKRQRELQERAAELAVLARYHIHWNGHALDFADFAIDANDGKTPAARGRELREAMTKLDKLLPQGTRDPRLSAFNRLLQGSPWEQFQARLQDKWQVEGRKPVMEWFNLNKINRPQPGAAVVFRRNETTREYDLELQPLQTVRDEANRVAGELRRRVLDHTAQLTSLRAASNRLMALVSSTRDYHLRLDANFASIRQLSEQLGQFGGISVEMNEGGRQIGPLPAHTVAIQSQLEYTHDLRADMEHMMQLIARDRRWQAAMLAAHVATTTLQVASGVGILTLPLRAGQMLRGATTGLRLSQAGFLADVEVVSPMRGRPSQQTYSDLGPEALMSAATFGLGEGTSAMFGWASARYLGGVLTRAEAPASLVGRAALGSAQIASNETLHKMFGMGLTHVAVHLTGEAVTAGLNGRAPHLDWVHELGGGAQTGMYMFGLDQRAAGLLRFALPRVAASVAVNQGISLGMNAWNIRSQIGELRDKLHTARTQHRDDEVTRLEAQLRELTNWNNQRDQLLHAALTELPTHLYFGMQAATAAGRMGIARQFALSADPANRGVMERLQSRMTRQNEGPSLLGEIWQWGARRVTGAPAPTYGESRRGNSEIGATVAGQLPQYEVGRVVAAARINPTGDAATAVRLLAEHYQMKPERFMQVWAEWSASGRMQPTRALGAFGTGQATRQGRESSLPVEGRDHHQQVTRFLELAEQHVMRDLQHAQQHGTPAERETRVAEYLALRPDQIDLPLVQGMLPIDGLVASAQGTRTYTEAQRTILQAMAARTGLEDPRRMAAFFQSYTPRPGERLDWASIQSLVNETANPYTQLQMMHDRRLTLEGIAGMWGVDVAEATMQNYLRVSHPTWNYAHFRERLIASGQSFTTFEAVYRP